MYIPIGPSKKQLYKIIIILLLSLVSFTSLKSCVKAYTQTNYINCGFSGNAPVSDLIDSAFYSRQPINCSGNAYEPMVNYGEGTLIFSFGAQNYDSSSGQWHEIIAVSISADGEYTCDLGSTTQWLDNGTQYIITTAKCPVKFSNGQGINSINFQRNGSTGRVNVKLSEYATFVSKDTTNVNVNQQEVVNAVNSSSQQMITQIQNQTQSINDIKDAINDSSIDSSSATDFKNNSAFQDSNGLDAIIKAPLNFIQSLTSSTCSSISLTIPYIDANVSLPCMSTIYTKALGQQLVNLIALVINGVVLYRYCLKILQIVKDAKNPNKDGLEVLDL